MQALKLLRNIILISFLQGECRFLVIYYYYIVQVLINNKEVIISTLQKVTLHLDFIFNLTSHGVEYCACHLKTAHSTLCGKLIKF